VSTELELEFIELAVGKGRRVQTAEGARFYGQPIGTLITPDMIKKARSAAKAKGITPPKGGLSPKKAPQVSVGAGKASPAGNFNADPSAGAPVGADTSGKFQVKPSSIKGPQGFKVGATQYSAPSGSKLIRPKNQEEFAYVVTPDGSVHAFTAAGELDVPDYLEPVLTKKFKDLKGDDTLYKVDTFDAPSSLAEQKPGSTLSKNGKPLFKKQANGVWMNEDIGAELTDDDLQRLYDGGSFDLEPANTVEDIDFSKLTTDELQAALEAMPDGKQMKFSKTVVTKKNGKWNSSATGKNTSSEDLAYMSAGTGSITDKLDNPEVAPEPGKADKAAKEKEASDPLRNPENELNETNAQKKKATEAKATGAEILKSEVGAVVYHDVAGALTKQDNSTWENTDGASFAEVNIVDSANMGYISNEPWTPEQKDAKEKFDAENTLTVGGKELSTVGKFGENDRSEAIKADGGSTPNVFELEATPENVKTFRDAMQKSLEGNPYSASVYVYDESDYAGMRLFLSDDGKSGIALHDGDEIVSVFSDPKSKNKKVARHLISVAVENGGKRLDAFDTVLPGIYAKEGFIVKSRLKWDDDFAPENWNKETFKKFNNGEPDVVFMQYEKGMEDLDYEPGSGDYVDDYDKGLASTGGKAQDENDYRPEIGDPDNEENSVETTKSGYVVNDEVKSSLAEGKKINAILNLKNSNKGMSLAEAKKEIDAMVLEGYQPGDTVSGNMLWELPEGAKIKTASGGEFTKNENGNWVTKNGGVFSSSDMYDDGMDAEIVSNPAAKQKKIEAPKVEEPEVDPDEEFHSLLEANEVTVEKLIDLKAGDIISNGEFEFTKDENDKFVNDQFLYEFDADDFSQDIDNGKISIVEQTGSDDEEAVDADTATVDDLKAMKPGDSVNIADFKYVMNDDGKLVSDTSGWLFDPQEFEQDLKTWGSKKSDITPSQTVEKYGENGNEFLPEAQAKQAIESLEAHSGFQIKYGLKSLPEDHPLKNQEYLDGYLADAKQNFSDLSPKAALLAQLKLDAKVEKLDEWEKELLAEGSTDKIQIGSRTPKTNATGVTGGQFNKGDVQSAIDILENYNGKLFKSELNKKGNPLGKLSPNDIVGFDKDKTLTKQKFIDLLKKKVAPKEAPVEEAMNKQFDISQEPEEGKVVAADPDMSALKNAPVGTIVSRPTPPYMGTPNGLQKYQKNEDGTWSNIEGTTPPKQSDSVFFYNTAMSGGLKWSAPDVPEREDNGQYADGDLIQSFENFKNLPVGSEVSFQSKYGGDPSTYVKTRPDTWVVSDDPDLKLKDQNFKNSVEGGSLSYKKTEPTAPDADDSLDATLDAHFQIMAELDKAVSVLPAEERGENGDGYVIVHTEKGPKITWGKFGGGGIATVATDENGVKKVLIGKRGDRDEWYLPGGAIDENESHLQGSLREFTEEVEDGDAILDSIQITQAYQAVIGKIEGTDKDWKYVTSVATLPSMIDVKAPDSIEDWELKEYQWFSAEELNVLDAEGKLHPALGGGNLAKMVGFYDTEVDDLHADILSLMNEPDNLNEDRYDISNWKKVDGGQGGSNPGGVYEDPLGNKYYVKESNGGEAPMHNEVIGGALYKAAGVNSNEVFFVTKGDQRLLATPWIENNGQKMLDVLDGNENEFRKKAQADFAIDAWLDNYDVVGIGPWNLVADENGDPLRLDPGGSMMFRATGAEKSWWSDEPTAIDDMRFGSSNSSAYTYLPNVFGDMTGDQVKESAKKLLAVTPEKISTIVNSSGLDEDTKAKLYSTLVIRREKILDRFGLTPEGTTIDVPEAVSGTPAFTKGTTVKLKGTGQQFQVELSNNEATAGLVDGKFLVFLNDELTGDLEANFSAQHAFTSNGENFKQAEAVEVIDPKNPGQKIPGFVMKADWSSGLVQVMTGAEGGETTSIEVDKSHITKMPQQAPQRVELPEGYAKVPEGQKAFGKYPNLGYYVTVDESDETHVYGIDGSSWAGGPKAAYEQAFKNPESSWEAWSGDGSAPEPQATPEVETPADGPKDSAGQVVAMGDNVTIVKYNKGGLSNKATIVSINSEKGTAKVRRLDENGVPMVGENGKPLYATMSLSSLRKDNQTVNESGLPTGITMSGGDKNSPLYGQPEPVAPAATPQTESDAPIVSDEWISKATEAYKAYRSKKGLPEKDLKLSTTAWGPIERAMKGDESALTAIKTKGYLDEDPALYEEIQQAIDAQKLKYADIIAQHEQAVTEYQKQKSEWMTANGVASYTPIKHEQTLQMNENESKDWALKKYTNILSKLTSKAKQGLQSQKVSSDWQTVIRKLPAILGLRREDVASAPGVHEANMQTWDNIKEATDQAGPVGEAFRAVRTISFDRLVGPDGNPLTSDSDLTKIIGSIQKDHGAMEIVPGSVDHGGKIADFYPVIMDLAVPADAKGMYTGFEEFSYNEEHGIIMEPGLAMYIWGAEQKKIPQLGGLTKWVVKASIIPRDVLPYMNNFQGDPMSHNILIPGKDTTTGITSSPFSEENWGKSTLAEIKKAKIDDAVVDFDGKQWKKINDISTGTKIWWQNGTGKKASDQFLFDNFMGEKPAPEVFETVQPKGYRWTESKLDNLSIGDNVVDSDGDIWQKISGGEWKLIQKNGPSNYLEVGEVRSSYAVASYM